MCSINDTGDIEDLSNSAPIFRVKVLSDKCNKCKENKPHILLRNKDVYCKNCFLASSNHKFRALLGKHKMIKDNDKVLIVYTGGHPTTSLLHLLKTGLEIDTPKKIRFTPICLFVENEYNLPIESRLLSVNSIVDELRKFNIPLFFSSLLDFHKEGFSKIRVYEKVEDFLNESNKLIKREVSEISNTLSSDLEKIYERRFLVLVAKKLNCKFVFSPEVSTNIASQILSDVALGRGSQIPSTTGFCDDRDEEVVILRPLRVFDIKELALYNYFHHLDPVILKGKPESSSIQNLIESFIHDLQSSYPATVTTVLKTGDKLSMANKKKKTTEICHICQSPVDSSSWNLTASNAVKFSSGISRMKNFVLKENQDSQGDKKVCFPCSKVKDHFL